MAYTDFDKLKTFFLALNKSGYRPERMDPKIITPKDKAYCFNLLREKIPELKDKTDNDLIEFLKDPKKVKERILGKFAVGEGFELTKILDEKPIIAEGVGGQPSDQAAPAEIPPAGRGMPSMPSITAPAIHPVYRTKPPVPEPPKPDIIKPTSRFNFSSFKSRMSNFAKTAQNFAGRANPWLKTNLGRVGRGLTQSVLPSGANFLGRTGLNAINHGGNFLSNLSSGRSRLASGLKGAKSRVSSLGEAKKLSLGIGLFFMIFLIAALGGMLSTSSTGEAAPIDSTAAPPYQPGAGKGIISCPFNASGNPRITNGSKSAGGHCSKEYEQDYGVCALPNDPNYTGKETAIDVVSDDRQVYLPRLNNATVNWYIEKIDTNTDYVVNGKTVNGGYSVRATALSEGKTYRMRFVHMNQPSLQEGQLASSDIPVGAYRAEEAHVHITVKEDDNFKPADLDFNLCEK